MPFPYLHAVALREVVVEQAVGLLQQHVEHEGRPLPCHAVVQQQRYVLMVS